MTTTLAFKTFLRNLRGASPAHAHSVRAAERVWSGITAHAGVLADSLLLPVTSAHEDGSIELEWNVPNYYASVVVTASGAYSWTYLSLVDGEAEGTQDDELVASLPAELLRKFRVFA